MAELKRQLVRAAIAALRRDPVGRSARAIRLSRAVIHTVPPRVPSRGRDAARDIQRDSAIRGVGHDRRPRRAGTRRRPQRYLDIIGVNFYAANQWEVPGGRKLHWDAGSNDPRWVPCIGCWRKFTSAISVPCSWRRPATTESGARAWMREIADECRIALDRGVPSRESVFIPILDRFDWEDPHSLAQQRSVGHAEERPRHYRRVLNQEYARALRSARGSA